MEDCTISLLPDISDYNGGIKKETCEFVESCEFSEILFIIKEEDPLEESNSIENERSEDQKFDLLFDPSYNLTESLQDNTDLSQVEFSFSNDDANCNEASTSIAEKSRETKFSQVLRQCFVRLEPLPLSVCQRKSELKNAFSQNVSCYEPSEDVRSIECNRKNKLFQENNSLAKLNDTPEINSVFSCKFCGKCFKYEKVLRTHVQRHLDTNRLRCSVCLKSFSSSFHLNSHIWSIHETDKPFKCTICPKGFGRIASLKRHMIYHESERHFKCTVCLKGFYLAVDLRRHTEIHENKRKYECGICFKRFNQVHGLSKHKRIHKREKQYESDICLKRFNQQNNLSVRKRMYKYKKQFKCDICFRRFNQQRGLSIHKRVHKIKKQYECNICLKSFHQQRNLSAHKRAHKNKEQFESDICLKRFDQQSNLSVHKSGVYKKTCLTCSICLKRFNFTKYFEIHINSHENEKGVKCTTCPEEFKELNDLKEHLEGHKAEGGFKCIVCSRRLYNNSFQIPSDGNAKLPKTTKNTEIKPNHLAPFDRLPCTASHSKSDFKDHLDDSASDLEQSTDDTSPPIKCKEIIKNNGVYKKTCLTCSVCLKRFNYTKYFEIHINSHENEKGVKCTTCPEGFKELNDLKEHLEEHEAKGCFKCIVCSRRFDEDGKLKMLTMYQGNRVSLQRKIRPKRFDFADKPKRHTADYSSLNHAEFSHPNDSCQIPSDSNPNLSETTQNVEIKPNWLPPLDCLPCTASHFMSDFEDPLDGSVSDLEQSTDDTSLPIKCKEIIEHDGNSGDVGEMNEQQKTSSRFSRDYYKQVFNGKNVLRSRTRKHFNGFKCSICLRRFRSSFALKSHILSVHETDRPFKCTICSKGFDNQGSLIRHMLYHESDRPLKCPICVMGFLQPSELKKHMELHENKKKYECGICLKGFNQRVGLITHRRTHKNKKILTCSICLKEQRLSNYLRKPINCHENENCFKCTICPSLVFKQMNNLKSHLLKHEAEGCFKCAVCLRGFDDGNLQRSTEYHENKRSQSLICLADLKRHTADNLSLYQDDSSDGSKIPSESNANISKRTYNAESMRDCFVLLERLPISVPLKSDLVDHLDDTGSFIEQSNDCSFPPIEYKQINRFDDNSCVGGELNDQETNPQFCCDYCKQLFKTKNVLRNHIVSHMYEITFKCTICLKVFNESSNLKGHMAAHENRRQSKLSKCIIFPKGDKNSCNFGRSSAIHENKNSFKCTMCTKVFNLAVDLKRHRKIHKIQNFKCYVCLKECPRAYNLITHLAMHSNERPFKCTMCSMSYKFSRDLKIHLKSHEREKTYKCSVCSQVFDTLLALKKHAATEAKRRFKCSVCPKRFRQASFLRRHLLYHDNKRRFKCEICSKGFNMNTDLKRHVAQHENKRLHKCDVCFKGFNHHSILLKHKLIH